MASSGSSVVWRKAVSGLCEPESSGVETTNFLSMVMFAEWLGLWTLMSVLYSPGARPMFSAALVSTAADVGIKGLGILQTHFALYSKVAAAAAPDVGLSRKTVNVAPAMVEMSMPLSRAKTIFLIF